MRLRNVFLALLLLIGAGVSWLVFKSYTSPVFARDGIADLTTLQVDGDTQHLLIRGQNRNAPVLLFLHGGPGMPAMYLAHSFQRPLEKDFVVVHWDQRAAGKSYQEGIDPELIRTSRLLADTRVVIEHLNRKFPGQPVFLAGHSHGSYLGALLAWQNPELMSAFIGVGQVADERRTIGIQDGFLKTYLEQQGLAGEIAITDENRETLLFESGAEIYGETSFIPLLTTGMMAPEYSLFDILNVPKGSSFSSRHMNRDVIDGSLMDNARSFDVPVYFIMGAHDMVTPVSLAREYYEQLDAPHKEFVLMEEASHFPFFVQPKAFAATMNRIKDDVLTQP